MRTSQWGEKREAWELRGDGTWPSGNPEFPKNEFGCTRKKDFDRNEMGTCSV
jgi:hypothetical protein